MKMLRIFFKNIRDAFKSVVRNFSLSIASITCITITLILVAVAIIVSTNVNHFTKKLEEELTIIVYLNEETTEETRTIIESQIKNMPAFEELTFKSKDQWKLEMQASSQELNTTLNYLETNPLLDSYTVKVKSINDLSAAAKTIRELEGVKSAKYGEETVDQLIIIFNVIEKSTFVLVIALILVTAFLISNTIKLTIFSRRNEIEIMRLVGTSNSVIKQPFIIEGLILGVIGSIIPIILTIYGYILLYEHFDGYLFSHIIELIAPSKLIWFASLVIVVIGGLVGMFGSWRAVRKYLKI